jgi:hypothetical protein
MNKAMDWSGLMRFLMSQKDNFISQNSSLKIGLKAFLTSVSKVLGVVMSVALLTNSFIKFCSNIYTVGAWDLSG